MSPASSELRAGPHLHYRPHLHRRYHRRVTSHLQAGLRSHWFRHQRRARHKQVHVTSFLAADLRPQHLLPLRNCELVPNYAVGSIYTVDRDRELADGEKETLLRSLALRARRVRCRKCIARVPIVRKCWPPPGQSSQENHEPTMTLSGPRPPARALTTPARYGTSRADPPRAAAFRMSSATSSEVAGSAGRRVEQEGGVLWLGGLISAQITQDHCECRPSAVYTSRTCDDDGSMYM
ncbi:hypothetical protein CF327_g5096 [Tilletia walkeri]|uniref:Uncharacterized protein n=1 Tax=Tilletia walkeri TaxID=117179 RepID=A0A8X7N2M2_9BASI|nr:hypothetical protein CF327_g5096 [Tilletia walkeri]KAE8261066.1 hypothetical protein A4X09_0g7718 [Tilletia walkeri]